MNISPLLLRGVEIAYAKPMSLFVGNDADRTKFMIGTDRHGANVAVCLDGRDSFRVFETARNASWKGFELASVYLDFDFSAASTTCDNPVGNLIISNGAVVLVGYSGQRHDHYYITVGGKTASEAEAGVVPVFLPRWRVLLQERDDDPHILFETGR